MSENSIPEVKALDLATVIRLAILHGRGHDCTPETHHKAHKITDEDQAVIMSFDPEGIRQFDRLQELQMWAWENRKRGAA